MNVSQGRGAIGRRPHASKIYGETGASSVCRVALRAAERAGTVDLGRYYTVVEGIAGRSGLGETKACIMGPKEAKLSPDFQ